MPDQFGNPTTREVLAQINDEKNLMISRAGSPDERRNALLFAMGRLAASGQDPRLMQAQAIEDAQTEVQAIPRDEGESELTYTRRLTSALADRLRTVDPSASNAARMEAKKLEAEEQNRRILQQQEQMNEQTLTERAGDQTLRERFEDMGYVIDLKSGDVLGQVQINDPQYAEKVEAIRKGNPMITDVPYDEMIAMAKDPVRGVGKQVSVNQFGDLTAELDENFKMGVTVNQLLDVVEKAWTEDGINTVSDFNAVASSVNSAVAGLSEGFKSIMKDGTPLQEYLDSPRGQELLQRASAKRITESLMTSLAYMFAMARNDRVTDADLEAAITMLGGNGGDIRTAVEAIDIQMRNQQATWGALSSSVGLPPDQGGIWSPGQYHVLQEKERQAKRAIDGSIERANLIRSRAFRSPPAQSGPYNPPGAAPAAAGTPQFDWK